MNQAALVATVADNRRGIYVVVLASVLGTGCDVATRLALEDGYPLTEVVFVRGVLSLICLMPLITASRGWGAIWVMARPLILIRTVFDTCQVILFLAAVAAVPLAIAISGLSTMPIWLTFLSIFVLNERVGWRRWLAVFVGFCGMFLILKPDTSAFNILTLFAIGAGLMAAARDISTRRIDAAVSPWMLTFISVVMVTVVGAAAGIFDTWRPVSTYLLVLLGASGILQMTSMYCIIAAVRSGEISVIAPFRYTALIWALLAGYVIFGEVIDGTSLAGVALIVGAGIYTLWREAVLRKRRAISTL